LLVFLTAKLKQSMISIPLEILWNDRSSMTISKGCAKGLILDVTYPSNSYHKCDYLWGSPIRGRTSYFLIKKNLATGKVVFLGESFGRYF